MKNGSQTTDVPLLKRYDVFYNSVNEVIFQDVHNFFKLPSNDSLLFVTKVRSNFDFFSPFSSASKFNYSFPKMPVIPGHSVNSHFSYL
jgi:hypothetical protein